MNPENINPDDFPPQQRAMIEYLLKLREKAMSELMKVRARHYDPRRKTVGDRVMIWDLSFAEDVEENARLSEIIVKAFTANENELKTSVTRAKSYVNSPCIVVQEKQNYTAELMGHTKTLDLIVWNSVLQRHVRTASEFVKLLD